MSTANRALKPYPPVGLSVVDTAQAGGDTAVSWKNRNRTIASIRKQTDPTDPPEAGQTTTLRFYAEDGTLIRTVAGQTGTSYSYDDVTEIADAGTLQSILTITLSAVRDGYESARVSISTQRASFIITESGSHVVTESAGKVII